MGSSRVFWLSNCIIVLALSLLLCSIATTSILWIEPTELGLASLLPLTYWIGLFLVFSLWYIGRGSKRFLVAALILTVAYLYVAPTMMRVPPWISNSFYPFGESLLINSTGRFEYRSSATLVSYHSWPIFLYFASILTLVTGIPPTILIKYFPLFTVSMYGLLSVLILRTTLKFQLALLGAGWLLGSFFIRQQYFGPQSIAYIFFLLIFLFVVWLFFDKRANQTSMIVLLLFLLMVTTFTHPLTSFMSVILLVALYLTYRLLFDARERTRKPVAIIGRLCLISIIVWLVYNSYVARGFFSTGVEHFYEIFLGERDLSLYAESRRLVGSQAMQLNVMSSWAIVLLGGGIGLLLILYLIKSWRGRTESSVVEYSFFNVILLVMMGLFAFVGEYGAHEAYQRAFMFGLIPISYLIVRFLGRKPRIVIVFLVGLLFLNIPAQYGADTYRLATDTQLAGSAFVAEFTPQNVSFVGKFSLYIRYYDPLKDFTILPIVSFPFTSLPNSSAVNEVLKDADYILLSDLQDNYYLYFLGSNPLEQADLEKFNMFYDNGRFQLAGQHS